MLLHPFLPRDGAGFDRLAQHVRSSNEHSQVRGRKHWCIGLEIRHGRALPGFARPSRHCEERSDEAIQCGASALDCFASLAMTRMAGTRIYLHDRRQMFMEIA